MPYQAARLNATFDKKRRVLVLQANNAFRSDLAYARRCRAEDGANNEISTALHEAYELVAPEHIPGALTDAPILVDCDGIDYPDNGEKIIRPSALVFWYPDYAILDPWAILAQRGRVEFAFAGDDVDPKRPTVAEMPADLAPFLPDGDRCGEAFYIGEGVEPRMAPILFEPGTDNHERCEATPGYYFWSAGSDQIQGPFPPTFPGIDSLRRAGGYLPERTYEARQMERTQGELPL